MVGPWVAAFRHFPRREKNERATRMADVNTYIYIKKSESMSRVQQPAQEEEEDQEEN